LPAPVGFNDKPWNPLEHYGMDIKDRSAELFDYCNLGRLTELPELEKNNFYVLYLKNTQIPTGQSKEKKNTVVAPIPPQQNENYVIYEKYLNQTTTGIGYSPTQATYEEYMNAPQRLLSTT